MIRGAAWERRLELAHDRYRRDGLAVVFRTPPVVQMLGSPDRQGRFTAHFRGYGPPDYVGIAAEVGAVAFDAKSTSTERLRLSAIPAHQARDLEAVQLHGGISFIALSSAAGDWVLPWLLLGPLWWAWSADQSRRASLGEQDLRALGAPIETVDQLPDWLSALRRTL